MTEIVLTHCGAVAVCKHLERLAGNAVVSKDQIYVRLDDVAAALCSVAHCADDARAPRGRYVLHVGSRAMHLRPADAGDPTPAGT
jgi:hypothetical protein